MKKRVLVVEDSRTQMERLRFLLEKEGYEVQGADDGQDALDKIASRPPDMVVTDVVMPRIDGYELCVRLRADARTEHVPIIMLTSRGEPMDIIKGLEAGADNFITKPYEDLLLLGRMRAVFAERAVRPLRKFRLSMELDVFGRKISVTEERLQIVELLLSATEELAQANKDLQQARLEADRANQAKSEFLSRMSHELRTPLNAILGFGQLMEMDTLTSEQLENVSHILKAGHHLLELINEVLDIARIEAGHLSLSLEALAVREIVQETLGLIAPLAAKEQVRLEDGAAIPADRFVLADRQRLKQVLLNLLANAAKYNRKGGTVTLSVQDAPQARLRIKVTDTGAGIPPEQLLRLFAPFERLGAEQMGVEGTGLGLALSRRLVELMGGVLDVESTIGVGSTFWVELPVAEEPSKRVDPTLLPSIPPAAGRVPFDGERVVLYIEDNPSNLELIERALVHRPGVRLVPAMQGRLGLDLARKHVPDLILLDLHLPDLPGEEVLRRLRADPQTSSIPVVVLSADASSRQAARLIEAGALAYLAKPLDVRKFLEVMDQTLAKASR